MRKEGRKERRFPPPTGNTNFTGRAKGASPPASVGEAGRAHQSKCGSARPPVWHPGSSRLQVSPSKVWSLVAASTSPGDLREAHVPGPQPRPDALGGGARRWASDRAPQQDTMRLRGEPTAPGHSLTSNSDAGNPWGPGCPPEGAGARSPFPKALVGLLPSPLPWPHLRVSISGAHLCFSWDPQTGPRALPQRRHRRCGARGLLPAPCGWTFRVPGQTMGPHITGEVAGTGTWTMGLCFSPRLPAAALSPGAAREAEPSKA